MIPPEHSRLFAASGPTRHSYTIMTTGRWSNCPHQSIGFLDRTIDADIHALSTFGTLGLAGTVERAEEKLKTSHPPVTYPFDAETLIDICRENDVAMVGVFGSMARAEADAESDIDVLVEFSTGKSLLTLVALERKLSSALGRKVDLLTAGAISPYLRDGILGDLRVLYDAR